MRLDDLWASLFVASLPPAPGLTASSCSCGREFATRFFRLRLAATPCVSLRLPSSVPIGSFHPIRFCPCWAHDTRRQPRFFRQGQTRLSPRVRGASATPVPFLCRAPDCNSFRPACGPFATRRSSAQLQYRGTVGSMRRLHRSIPPDMLRQFSTPWRRSQSTTDKLRTPWWQKTTISLASCINSSICKGIDGIGSSREPSIPQTACSSGSRTSIIKTGPPESSFAFTSSGVISLGAIVGKCQLSKSSFHETPGAGRYVTCPCYTELVKSPFQWFSLIK